MCDKWDSFSSGCNRQDLLQMECVYYSAFSFVISLQRGDSGCSRVFYNIFLPVLECLSFRYRISSFHSIT